MLRSARSKAKLILIVVLLVPLFFLGRYLVRDWIKATKASDAIVVPTGVHVPDGTILTQSIEDVFRGPFVLKPQRAGFLGLIKKTYPEDYTWLAWKAAANQEEYRSIVLVEGSGPGQGSETVNFTLFAFSKDEKSTPHVIAAKTSREICQDRSDRSVFTGYYKLVEDAGIDRTESGELTVVCEYHKQPTFLFVLFYIGCSVAFVTFRALTEPTENLVKKAEAKIRTFFARMYKGEESEEASNKKEKE